MASPAWALMVLAIPDTSDFIVIIFLGTILPAAVAVSVSVPRVAVIKGGMDGWRRRDSNRAAPMMTIRSMLNVLPINHFFMRLMTL